MIIPLKALVSARDSHIKPDSEAGWLIRVEGWYIWKISCHNLFITYSTLTFFCIDFYIAEEIFELTNCENKSIRELPLLNLQIFLFRVLYNDVIVFVKSTQDVDIWMEILIQDYVYIWAYYSVSSYLNFIPIFWLKYDFMHHLSLYFDIFSLRPLCRYRKLNSGTNTDIQGPIRIFALRANNQHWLLAIIGHAKTNILQQNMW
jgi:hypothetical protein